MGRLVQLWRNMVIIIGMKVEMLESIVIPTVIYGSDTWVLNIRERRRAEI